MIIIKNVICMVLCITFTSFLFGDGTLLIPFRNEDKWGYSDITGRIIINAEYKEASPFVDGHAIVHSSKKGTGVLSIGRGSQFVENDIQYGELSENLITCLKSGKWGFANLFLIETIKCQYDWVLPFKEGLAIVRMNGKYGFIDKKGDMIIACQYENARDFSNGLAAVNKGGKWGFVDPKGNVKISFSYSDALAFSEGLAPVLSNGKWGYINTSGEIKLNPSYNRAGSFHEGLASVSNSNNVFGCIDKNGKVVIPFNYTYIADFSEGIAPAYLISKWGFIDRKGDMVIPFKYEHATSFANGIARVWTSSAKVSENGTCTIMTPCGGGYIDRNGKEYWIDKPWYKFW